MPIITQPCYVGCVFRTDLVWVRADPARPLSCCRRYGTRPEMRSAGSLALSALKERKQHHIHRKLQVESCSSAPKADWRGLIVSMFTFLSLSDHYRQTDRQTDRRGDTNRMLYAHQCVRGQRNTYPMCRRTVSRPSCCKQWRTLNMKKTWSN